MGHDLCWRKQIFVWISSLGSLKPDTTFIRHFTARNSCTVIILSIWIILVHPDFTWILWKELVLRMKLLRHNHQILSLILRIDFFWIKWWFLINSIFNRPRLFVVGITLLNFDTLYFIFLVLTFTLINLILILTKYGLLCLTITLGQKRLALVVFDSFALNPHKDILQWTFMIELKEKWSTHNFTSFVNWHLMLFVHNLTCFASLHAKEVILKKIIWIFSPIILPKLTSLLILIGIVIWFYVSI